MCCVITGQNLVCNTGQTRLRLKDKKGLCHSPYLSLVLSHSIAAERIFLFTISAVYLVGSNSSNDNILFTGTIMELLRNAATGSAQGLCVCTFAGYGGL